MDPGRTPNFWLSRSTSPTSFTPFGRSHCTCSARVGQAPVEECTCAASLNFSSIVVAAAAWMNLPKRVPVFAKPQDGSSILSLSSACHAFSIRRSFISLPCIISRNTLRHRRARTLLHFGVRRLRRQHLRVVTHALGSHSAGIRAARFRRCQLNRKISNRCTFARPGDYFQTRPLRRQPVEICVLAAAAHNKESLQLLAGDSRNRSEHIRIPRRQTVEYRISHPRNVALVHRKGRKSGRFHLFVDFAVHIAGQHKHWIVHIEKHLR